MNVCKHGDQIVIQLLITKISNVFFFSFLSKTVMLNKISRYLFIIESSTIMNKESCKTNAPGIESESFNLLLNKPEAHALKSGHCMKKDCSLCKVLSNTAESQSSVIVPVTVKDCQDLEKESNVSFNFGFVLMSIYQRCLFITVFIFKYKWKNNAVLYYFEKK